jgi:hypothetical protein
VLQVVSSALSNLEQLVIRRGSATMPDLGPCFDTQDGVRVEATLLPGIEGHTANPVTTLNAGVLTFRRSGAEWMVRVRLLGPPQAEGEPLPVVYDSGEL